MSANYKFHNNSHQSVVSDFYYYKTMSNNVGGTNIPMQTVSIPTKETKTRNSTEQKSAKCVQCILPLLCILQVINVVTVSFCFYQYGTLEKDFQTLQVDLQGYKNQIEQNISAKVVEVERLRNDLDQDIKNFRNEIAVNLNNQEEMIKEAKGLVSNLNLAKKSMYDYDPPSYDDTNYDEEVDETPPPPPLIVTESEEEDNHRPLRPILTSALPKVSDRRKPDALEKFEDPSNESDTENATYTAETEATSTGNNEDEDTTYRTVNLDEPTEEETEKLEDLVLTSKPENSSDKVKRQTRNIYKYQKEKDSYWKDKGLDLEKNETEEDYRTTESLNRPRKVPKVEIEEKVKMEKASDRLHSVPKQNSFIHNSVEPSNLTKTIIPRTEDEFIQRKEQETLEEQVRKQQENLLAMQQIVSLKTGLISIPDHLDRSTPETVAIHLVGDTSKPRLSKEKHYDANHRMYHPKGHIKDWNVDSRTIMDDKSNHDQYFKLENGHLKVKQGGLYFVYAQIFYSTKEDTSGFNVYVNDNVVMRCITTGVSTDQIGGVHSTAPNSCYTAGLVRIQPNDNLSIKEMQGERFTVFEPTRSFFGLFKLG
uniref:Protein eiger n=1 Tax=Cacopsylla melanoneura TaxID=428564 RepID=A0A8D9AKR9_9HEMI